MSTQLTNENIQPQRRGEGRQHRASLSEDEHKMNLSHPAHRRQSRMLDDDDAHAKFLSTRTRRMSMAKRPSLVPSNRTSESLTKREIRLENTYRMGPKEGEKFQVAEVSQIAHAVLQYHLQSLEYDSSRAGWLVRNMSEELKDRLKKQLKSPRYKYVCHVSLAENSGQGIQAASRCVWDTKTDNSATVSIKTKTMIAIATVYGIYLE